MSATATEVKDKDLEGTIRAKRRRVAELFEARKQPDGTFDLTPQERDEVKSLNAELDDLAPRWEQARADREAVRANLKSLAELGQGGGGEGGAFVHGDPRWGRDGANAPARAEWKSLGQRLVDAPGFLEAARAGNLARHAFTAHLAATEAEVKTLFAESAGFAPQNNRTDVVIFSPQRKPVVADLIPQDPTDNSVIRYMRETTFTNAAAPTAEGATKPEGALQFAEVDQTVCKIAMTLPVTEEQLMDVPQIRGIIDNRVGLMMLQAEEVQLLNGTGTAPQLAGFLTTTGVQTRASSKANCIVAIFKAMTDVAAVGFANPDAIVMNPFDWANVATSQMSTGGFVLGGPADLTNKRLWGLRVLPTVAMTAGTALVGDFAGYSHISRRLGVRIDVGYVGNQFAQNQQTIRAEMRESLEIYRPQAYEILSGINV